jgi:3-deoxy-D-manno-octulosonic-acid transferase
MASLLYNVLLTGFLLLYSPVIVLRSLFREDFRRMWHERLGGLPARPGERPVWVHAASVGEVLCTLPLIRRIRKACPSVPIVLTTMTRTGNETARRQVPEAERICFLPFDHPLTLRRGFGRIGPRLLLIAETELWPNLLGLCRRKGVPVVLFNGRISNRSFKRYLALRFFFARCLGCVSAFLMQTEEDRLRITVLGAPPERAAAAGNIKFDQAPPAFTEEEAAGVGRSLGVGEDGPVLIAGSTHPGEEEIVLSLFMALREEHPGLVLILAPRHLQRLDEVERLLKAKQVSWRRRTAPAGQDGSARVILLDTMGELGKLYALATLVFVGGSLVPVGGHNPLEPLLFGKAVLFGPHMFNFREMARLLVEGGGAVQVRDAEGLEAEAGRLLRDEAVRREMGDRGKRLLEVNRGATERVFRAIEPFLRDP